MPRVVHFEIMADDPDRATKFYEEVFGWKTQRWGEGEQCYWLMTTGDESEMGINGGIMRRDPRFPPVVNTLGVSDVDEYCEKVTAGGGKVTVPKTAVPGVGWIAYCEDTEGNALGVFTPDAAAK